MRFSTLMKNFVGTSPKTAINKIGLVNYRQHCGLITTPYSKQNPAHAAAVGASWIMDNGAFTEFKPSAFMSCLQSWRFVPHCQFVVAPDAIQDAKTTLDYFWLWQPVIQAFNLPVAFVLQNGMHEYRVPYKFVDALFIGGSTDFKFTSYVASVVKEANRRDIWTHNGRVNSKIRIQHSMAIGCDSFDGSGYAIDPSRIASEFSWWTTDHQKPVQFTLPDWSAA